MRVMLDTNVLISTLLFPSRHINYLIWKLTSEHTIVLSSYVVEELHKVVEKKFPEKVNATDRLLEKMSFELVYTPKKLEEGLVEIRDMNDYPVIYTAIKEEVDVLITGDKDFCDLGLEEPDIVTPTEFLAKY